MDRKDTVYNPNSDSFKPIVFVIKLGGSKGGIW